MSKTVNVKEFVEFIASSLVDNPDKVEVEETRGEKSIILNIRTDKSDFGKVVGVGGKTVNMIRTLANYVGIRHGYRVNVNVVD